MLEIHFEVCLSSLHKMKSLTSLYPILLNIYKSYGESQIINLKKEKQRKKKKEKRKKRKETLVK